MKWTAPKFCFLSVFLIFYGTASAQLLNHETVYFNVGYAGPIREQGDVNLRAAIEYINSRPFTNTVYHIRKSEDFTPAVAPDGATYDIIHDGPLEINKCFTIHRTGEKHLSLAPKDEGFEGFLYINILEDLQLGPNDEFEGCRINNIDTRDFHSRGQAGAFWDYIFRIGRASTYEKNGKTHSVNFQISNCYWYGNLLPNGSAPTELIKWNPTNDDVYVDNPDLYDYPKFYFEYNTFSFITVSGITPGEFDRNVHLSFEGGFFRGHRNNKYLINLEDKTGLVEFLGRITFVHTEYPGALNTDEPMFVCGCENNTIVPHGNGIVFTTRDGIVHSEDIDVQTTSGRLVKWKRCIGSPDAGRGFFSLNTSFGHDYRIFYSGTEEKPFYFFTDDSDKDINNIRITDILSIPRNRGEFFTFRASIGENGDLPSDIFSFDADPGNYGYVMPVLASRNLNETGSINIGQGHRSIFGSDRVEYDIKRISSTEIEVSISNLWFDYVWGYVRLSMPYIFTNEDMQKEVIFSELSDPIYFGGGGIPNCGYFSQSSLFLQSDDIERLFITEEDIPSEFIVTSNPEYTPWPSHSATKWQVTLVDVNSDLPDWSLANEFEGGIIDPSGTLGVSSVNFPIIQQAFETGRALFWRAGLVLDDGKTLWGEHHRIGVPPNKEAPLDAYLESFSDVHTNNINWTYNAGFYDGKVSESMVFADGMGMQRQQQSKNQVTGKILTQETVYSPFHQDQVSTLVAPSGQDNFNYAVNFFDVNDGGLTRDFAAQDFDVVNTDFSSGQYYHNPSVVDISNPFAAGRYYSNESYEPAVDNANGYPYQYGLTRDDGKTDLTPAGVGASFVLPERAIKHLYGMASPEEINIIYGPESGMEGTVKKNITYDANNVGNISYKNQEDLVVATAIQQCPAAPNLERLQPKTPGAEMGAGEPYDQDYLDNFKIRLEPLAGNNDIEITDELANEARATFTLPCASNELTKYYYNLEGSLSTYTIEEQCYVCGYTITVEVKNELTGEVFPELSRVFDINPEMLACGDPFPDGLPLDYEGLTLPGPATYVITRRIEPYQTESGLNTWEEQYDEWEEEFLSSGGGFETFSEDFFSYDSYFVLRKKETDNFSPYNPKSVDCYFSLEAENYGNGEDCNRQGLIRDEHTALTQPVAAIRNGFLTYILQAGSNSISKIDITLGGYTLKDFAGTPCVAIQKDGGLGEGAFFDPVDMVLDKANPDFAIVLEQTKIPTYPSYLRNLDLNTGHISLRPISDPGAFLNPEALASLNNGDVLVANTGGGNILRVSPDGTVAAVTINGYDFQEPAGIAVDANNTYLWISDRSKHQVVQINLATLEVVEVFGTSNTPGFADASFPGDAYFNQPGRLLCHSNGAVLVSEVGNHAVRAVLGLSKEVYTLIGSGQAGLSVGVGSEVALNHPMGLVETFNGDFSVCDRDNHMYRFIQSTICDTEADCEHSGTCVEVVDYLDEAWIEDFNGTQILTNLEGGYATASTIDDEQYTITTGAETEVIEGQDLWIQFEELYERQYNKEPPVLNSMFVVAVTQDEIGGLMPRLLDDGVLSDTESDTYLLLKTNISYGDCNSYCEVSVEDDRTAEEYCDFEFSSYKADRQQAVEAINNHNTVIVINGNSVTLSNLVEGYGADLPNDILDALDDESYELYSDYQTAHFAVTTFSMERCLTNYNEGGLPCVACAEDLELAMYSTINNLGANYWEFVDDEELWNGSTDFPYTLNDLQGEVINGVQYPANTIVEKHGNELAWFFLDNFNTLAQNSNWETTMSGADLYSSLQSIITDPNESAYQDCQSNFLNTLQSVTTDFNAYYPALILSILQDEFRSVPAASYRDGLPGFIYSEVADCAPETIEDAIEIYRAGCLEIAESYTDPVERDEQIAVCNNLTEEEIIEAIVYNDVVDEFNFRMTTIDAEIAPEDYEIAVQEVMAELIRLDNEQVQIDMLAIIDDYLAVLVMQKLCVLNCEGELSSAYEEWVERRKNEVRNQFEEAYQGACYSTLQEDFYLEYTDIPVHFTLYEYDEAQRLKATVPPEGIDYVLPGEAPCHRMRTEYTYKAEQVSEQKTPDGGITRFLYDSQGRLRFSQTAAQRQKSADAGVLHYNYIKYDRLNRITESGEAIDVNAEYSGWSQDCPDCGGIPESQGFGFLEDYADFRGVPFGDGFSTNTKKDNTVITYDVETYTFPEYQQDNTEGRVAAIANKNGSTHFSYDAQGRVKYVIHDIKDLEPNNIKWVEYKYSTISGTLNEVVYMEGVAEQEFRHQFNYDANNQLSSVAINEGTGWITVAQYDYYETGPLKTKTLGEKTQKIDYVYNINGWLKAINNPATVDEDTENTGIANDVFGELLVYHSGDYTRNNPDLAENPASGSFVSDPDGDGIQNNLYNGNIAATVILNNFDQVADQINAGNNTFPPDLAREAYAATFRDISVLAQGFTYDVLNRLTQGVVDEMTTYRTSSLPSWARPPVETTDFYTHVDYDANGNIMHMDRNFRRGSDYLTFFNRRIPNNNYQLDRLNYSYDASLPSSHPDKASYLNNCETPYKQTNRLGLVLETEGVGRTYIDNSYDNQNADHGFTYDANGRLIADLSEGIEKITWNSLNKIERIEYNTADEKEIRYTYDGSGNRQSKSLWLDGELEEQTFYVYGADNQMLATYNVTPEPGYTDSLTTTVDDVPIYGLQREGIFNRRKTVVDNKIDDEADVDEMAIASALITSAGPIVEDILLSVTDALQASEFGPGVTLVDNAVQGTVQTVENASRLVLAETQEELANLGTWLQGLSTTEQANASDTVDARINNILANAAQNLSSRVNVQRSFQQNFAMAAMQTLMQDSSFAHDTAWVSYTTNRYFKAANVAAANRNWNTVFQHEVAGLFETLAQGLPGEDATALEKVNNATAAVREALVFNRLSFDMRAAMATFLDNPRQSQSIQHMVLNGLPGEQPISQGAINNLATTLNLALLENGAEKVPCQVPDTLEGSGLIVKTGALLENLQLQYLITTKHQPLADGTVWNLFGLNEGVDALLDQLRNLLGPEVAEAELPFMVVKGRNGCLQITPTTQQEIETNLANHLAANTLKELPILAHWMAEHSNIAVNNLAGNQRSLGNALSHRLGQTLKEAGEVLGVNRTGEPTFGTASEEGPTEDFITYELTDHLGNVRATVNHVKTAQGQAYISSMQDYYPFGMVMPNRSYSNGNYRFGFNGMEKDDEIKGAGNALDFGARIYDNRLGRWHSRDPYATRYLSISPYAFVANNPVLFRDPDGRKIVIATKKGLLTYNNGVLTNKKGKHILADELELGKTIYEELENIRKSGSEGERLLSSLSSLPNEVLIKVTSKEESKMVYNDSKEKALINLSFTQPEIVTHLGTQPAPIFIVLSHELAHAEDYFTGMTRKFLGKEIGDIWLSKGKLEKIYPERIHKDVKFGEIYATHVENLIRAETHNPIRTRYLLFDNMDLSKLVMQNIRGNFESLFVGGGKDITVPVGQNRNGATDFVRMPSNQEYGPVYGIDD